MRLAALVVLLASPAAADPATPIVLEMRYLRSENLHLANQRGAINWHDEVTLRLELRANGKLAGRETGRQREHNLHASPSSSWTTEELQQWTHRWSGTWKLAGTALSLDAVLDNRTCTRTRTSSGTKPEQQACGTVTTKIHFDCTPRTVPLLAPSSGAQPKRDVWQCLPAGTVELDRTPTPWTFGKPGCIKMLGGQRGLSYEPC